jgi:predicted aspartyl protease
MKPLPRLLLPVALLMPWTAHAGSQALQRTSAGHLATQVQVRGHGEELFVVDTGASSSAVYEHTRTRMGLVPEPGAQVQMHGAGGSRVIQRYRLPRLSVAGVDAGALLVSGLPVGIKHGEEVMGVLGRDVLGGYMVEFDLVSHTLGLHRPGALPASSRGWDAVPITLMPEVGLVMLQVTLGGAPVTAVLDTGARKSFVNWRAAKMAGVTPKSEGLQVASKASGVTGHAFEYQTREFAGIGIGSTAFRPSTLAISDLPVFEPMGMDKAPGMIVGLDLMGDRRFIVDYPGKRLLIER